MAKAKTATTSAPSTVSGPALSIPSPVRPSDTATPTAADLLAALKGKKKPTAKSNKSDRPTLELTPSAIEAVRVWVPAKILADHFDEHLKNAKALLDDEIFDLYLKAMWDAKSQPANPALKVNDDQGHPDMEGMFVVMEKFSVQVPEIDDENDDRDSVSAKMIAQFVRCGVNAAKATQLVANEFIIREEKYIALTELMEGKKKGKEFVPPTTIGKAAAEKLIFAIAMNQPLNLTDEEREALIVTTSFLVSVKGGFLNRVCTYCDNFDQLKSIVKLLVKPVLSHRGAKIVNGSLEEKNCRLIGCAADILGEMTSKNDDE